MKNKTPSNFGLFAKVVRILEANNKGLYNNFAKYNKYSCTFKARLFF